jgi:hypothetical protein
MYASFVAIQRLNKHVPVATNTSKKRVCWSVYPSIFLGKNSVKTFPQQRKELMEASFSMGSMLCQKKVCSSFFPEFLVLYFSLFSNL